MKFPIYLLESSNYDERPKGALIDTIIIHYTGMESCEAALERLRDSSMEAHKRGRVSAHYVIAEDGKIFSMVDEARRAWHAGESYFRGHTNLNNTSIGIEMVNPGHELGYRVFPRVQLDALVTLCGGILNRYPISQDFILGHSDVAPGRKIDPGEKFNWRYLARKGIGQWPEPGPEDYARAQLYLSSAFMLRGAFVKFGYNPEVTLDIMTRAFNHHFGQVDSGRLTWEVAACLAWLNRNILKKAA